MSRLLKITDVLPIRAGVLRITWDDGVTREVDVRDSMTGHVLLEMLNSPEVFKDVSVVTGGGGIQWPNGADFCAQALRMRSDDKVNQITKVEA